MASKSPSKTEELYRALLLPRVIEEKMLRLIRQGRISKWFSGFGQEAIAVGTTFALKKEDYILPMHRNLGVFTTRGLPLERLFCQLMGKAGGYTKGRDRTFHFGILENNIVGMISQLAAMLPVADGLGLAAKLDKADRVAVTFVGEGSTREGDFHEAVNLASVWKLPVIFIVENNGYGLSTPTSAAVPVQDIALSGAGYNMRSVIVDGNDILAVIDAVQEARKLAVAGEGPTLLEMKTFRMRGHEEASGTKYVPKELMDRWGKMDPLVRFELAATRKLSKKRQTEIRKELTDRVDQVAEWALTQPEVTSSMDLELEDVFSRRTNGESKPRPAPVKKSEVPAESVDMRFIDAISEGLRTGMRENDKMVIMGQDIADYGGVFKVTQDFVYEFGQERVRNTPIIESGAVGTAMGLALAGYQPVLEIQYFDFITCGFNQIVNNLATTHYRWGAPLNVTIRAPFGGGIGAGPFHSQSMEAWFCHTPGLKVVIPYSPEDAKGLLLASLDDPNPVLFLEHKKLYRSLKGPVPTDAYRIELGQARIVREGTDVSVISYGIGVGWALEEAEYWSQKDVELEIIDLRTLIPWDRETVIESVKKTNKVIVLHEAPKTGGFGAEISAQISETVFEYLEAPPVRLGGADMPVPFSKQIEDEVYSAQSRLRTSLESLLAY